MKSFDELQDFKVTKTDKTLVEHVADKKRKSEIKTESSSTKKKIKRSDDKKVREPGSSNNNGKKYTLSPELAALAGTSTDDRFQVI